MFITKVEGKPLTKEQEVTLKLDLYEVNPLGDTSEGGCNPETVVFGETTSSNGDNFKVVEMYDDGVLYSCTGDVFYAQMEELIETCGMEYVSSLIIYCKSKQSKNDGTRQYHTVGFRKVGE